MKGKAEILRILKKTLKHSPADQSEVLLITEDSSLTRFANSSIHQNVAEENATLSVRVIFGKKIGSASTNVINDESLKKVVDKAVEIAKLQKENPDFVSLPERKKIREINTFFPATAAYSPAQRAEGVQLVVKTGARHDLSAFGAYSNGTVELGVANSRGIEAYTVFTDAFLNVIMMSNGASGYANSVSRNIEDIDPGKIAGEAAEKCLGSKDPREIEPGEYEVILEGYAVSDLLLFLGHLGFGALAVQEVRSFMCNKFGKRITGENITIWDDGLNPESFAVPFDFEGVPKEKVILVEKGIAKNVVYDSYTAAKEKRNSTGHALPSPNTHGPMPLNLFLQSGEATKEEMISSTKRGILVTRFHYTNVVEPMKTIITGMTRNGTFLVEEGKIKSPVKNLRFTESILKALSNVSMICREGKLASEGTIYERRFATGSVVPAIKVDKFNFSGVTQF